MENNWAKYYFEICWISSESGEIYANPIRIWGRIMCLDAFIQTATESDQTAGENYARLPSACRVQLNAKPCAKTFKIEQLIRSQLNPIDRGLL
jgi:hypothetical protein